MKIFSVISLLVFGIMPSVFADDLVCFHESSTGIKYRLTLHFTSDTLADSVLDASLDHGTKWSSYCRSPESMSVSGNQPQVIYGRLRCSDNMSYRITFRYDSANKTLEAQRDQSRVIDLYQCP